MFRLRHLLTNKHLCMKKLNGRMIACLAENTNLDN